MTIEKNFDRSVMTGQSESYHLVKEDVKGGGTNERQAHLFVGLSVCLLIRGLLQTGHPYAILTKNVYLYKTLA